MRHAPLGSLSPWVRAAIILLASAGSAFAQIGALDEDDTFFEEEVVSVPALRIGVALHGVIGSVAMTDMENAIDEVNGVIALQGTFVDSYDKPPVFPSIGLALRTYWKGTYLLSAEFERLARANDTGGQTKAKVETPASIYSLNVAYDLQEDPFRSFGFGIGVGRVSMDGQQLFLDADDEVANIGLKASGIAHQYFTFMELPLTDRIYVHLQTGWRFANAKDLEVSRLDEFDPPTNRTDFVWEPIVEDIDGNITFLGGGDEIDYSGLYGRIGMTVYWNPPTY